MSDASTGKFRVGFAMILIAPWLVKEYFSFRKAEARAIVINHCMEEMGQCQRFFKNLYFAQCPHAVNAVKGRERWSFTPIILNILGSSHSFHKFESQSLGVLVLPDVGVGG